MFFLNTYLTHNRLSSAASDASSPGGSAAGSSTLLDEAALNRLRELDPTGANQLMPRVLAAFDASLTRLMPQLALAQSAMDCNAIRHVAHTLKSSSASIGALHLSRLCAELETAARGGELDSLDAGVNAMRAECALVLRAAKQSFTANP